VRSVSARQASAGAGEAVRVELLLVLGQTFEHGRSAEDLQALVNIESNSFRNSIWIAARLRMSSLR